MRISLFWFTKIRFDDGYPSLRGGNILCAHNNGRSSEHNEDYTEYLMMHRDRYQIIIYERLPKNISNCNERSVEILYESEEKHCKDFCGLQNFYFYRFAPGPWRTLPGSIINAVRKEKSPFIVKPMIRNGSIRIQMMGYRSSANNANGQHKKRSMIQSINVNMGTSLLYSFILYGKSANYVTDDEQIVLPLPHDCSLHWMIPFLKISFFIPNISLLFSKA